MFKKIKAPNPKLGRKAHNSTTLVVNYGLAKVGIDAQWDTLIISSLTSQTTDSKRLSDPADSNQTFGMLYNTH